MDSCSHVSHEISKSVSLGLILWNARDEVWLREQTGAHRSCSATRAEQTLKALGRDGKEGEEDSKREGSRAPPEQLICYTSAVPTALKHLLHSPVPMTQAHIFTFWKTGLLLLTSSIFTTTWAVLVRGWGPPEALSSVAVTFRTYSVPCSSGNGLARSLTSPVKTTGCGLLLH